MSFSQVPACFGRSYDNESNICATCAVRMQCRQEVLKVSSSPYYTVPVPQTLVTPYQPPPAYYPTQQSAPVQVPVYAQPQYPTYQPAPPPPRPYVPAPPPPMQMQQQAAPQQMQPYQYQPHQWHRRIPDNVWTALASVPPIYRPPMPGESIPRWVAVSVGMNVFDTIFRELRIILHQLLFAPPVPPPSEQVIDVNRQASGR